MTRILLLTGASGFVGRQVLQALKGSGSKVRLIIREGKQDSISITNNIETIVTTLDLFAESADWWAHVCTGVDTIIHVAWYAEPGEYLQSEKNLDCLLGTLQLAKGAAQAGVRRFIGIGTCFEYDLTDGYLSVDTPLRPLTPYAAAKAATFMALTPWFSMQGIEFVWCRLFYLYGEGEDARRLAPYLRSKLSVGETAELTSGKQIRDYLDVSVVGRIIERIASSNRQGPVNICSGIPITVRQLAEQIADEYGGRDLLKFNARPDNLVDPPCVVGVVHGKLL